VDTQYLEFHRSGWSRASGDVHPLVAIGVAHKPHWRMGNQRMARAFVVFGQGSSISDGGFLVDFLALALLESDA
jgi:hypothetical protein